MLKCSTDKSGCTARCIKIGLLIVAGIAAITWVVMQLWNCLLPDLFAGVSRIGYWQALGVLVLSRILFGGLRGGGHGHWRERRAHWESMTPEERQQLKGRFGSRWGKCCSSPKAEAEENPGDAGSKPTGSV
ncbi:DUF3106 domain-containing protein [Dechloromonas sp. XY25]|uniref:DUF3106 domain-containing protein n=1 Tax=Dechloromonas hankyongensis TaxID=2908002 RepID=A0ABS9K3H2_9RHOO|nr:hypothetical protein [Dechloromonas hankyongensis]MCG2577614.1 DUF3106 domain-containing protein [Dechloromonas hankyongensis]